MTSRTAAIVVAILLVAAIAGAQDHAQHQHDMHADGWQWAIEGVAFGGYNYQRRKFFDFDEIESQNWLMPALARTFGNGSSINVIGMFSLEPFTLRKIGSPQVFQTGETFQGAPLIDYQHPHDLIMNLGTEIALPIGATTARVSVYAVGPAPLGPPPFMHRASAIDNPQAPLSHHYLDSTHVTPGVIALGIERSGFALEAGAFHGREPDEDRLDLDTAALDSYSARVSWADGPWQMQVSGGHLKTPERKSPYNENRITASATYSSGDARHSFAWTAAFGQNRDVFGNLEAYLLEASRHSGKNIFYGRAEYAAKDILDAGFHPIGIKHTHRQSPVGALTIGYSRNVASRSIGTFAIGGDVTGYRVPANLDESYGSPVSFHVFLKYSGRFGPPTLHRH